MHYLFLGEEVSAKDQKIFEIKKKFLTPLSTNKGSLHDALKFDFEILHATKLDPTVFKKSLLALPVIAPKRLLVVRTAHKLSTHNQKLILELLETKTDQIVLVLDSDEADPQNKFFQKLRRLTEVVNFKREIKRNVFDMTRAMSANEPVVALKILAGLLSAGNHPLQIMGGLVWFWGKCRERLSPESFKKGLLVLQEADLNIKRSRLKPEQSLEVLVIRLCSLIAC